MLDKRNIWAIIMKNANKGCSYYLLSSIGEGFNPLASLLR